MDETGKIPGEKKFLFGCLGISLILHLLTAKFSVGYHSVDEQFQILEFLSSKLGGAPTDRLPIEFAERIRSWMQPAIYWSLVQGFKALGIQSPFSWVYGFRIFTGLLGWLSLFGLALASKEWLKDWRARRFHLLALAFLWFLPALHVRPSSESMGGSFFLIGLSVACLQLKNLQKEKVKRWIWLGVGILFGLSFETRFQMGLMIAGFIAWFCIDTVRKRRLFSGVETKALTFTLVGLGAIIILGRWIDFWGYGEWCFSPYRYFSFNLVRGEVSKYGVAPWWDVFRMSFTESWPFLGLAVALCSVVAWIRHPMHPLTWSHLPFVIVHEMIQHKELRFFFPVAEAAPLLLALSLYSGRTQKFLEISDSFKKALNWPWKFLLFNNGVALAVLTVIPFSRTVQFYEELYRHVPKNGEKMEVFYQKNPYEILGNPIYFYSFPQLALKQCDRFEELVSHPAKTFWLAYPGFELPKDVSKALPQCTRVFQNIPAASQYVNWGNWLERTHLWSLYRCQNQWFSESQSNHIPHK